LEIPSLGGVAAVATEIAKADGVGFSSNEEPTPAPPALAPPKRGFILIENAGSPSGCAALAEFSLLGPSVINCWYDHMNVLAKISYI